MGKQPLIAEPFCEVPHMAVAHIAIIRKMGWKDVVLVPFTGWDYIDEFLKEGITVYIPPYTPPFLTPSQFRVIVRRLQGRARRKYGPGRLHFGLPNRDLYGHEGHRHARRSARRRLGDVADPVAPQEGGTP
jgi:hypothetical protein